MANRKYLLICKNEHVLPLPVIDKIVDKVLLLEHYKLDLGHCKAIGSSLEQLGNYIRKIELNENGINDEGFSYIINGAIKNRHIKALVIKNNEFKALSLKAILRYFEIKNPILEELIISGCKTKLSQTNELLKELSDYNNLKRLGFSSMKLDK